MSAGLSTAAIVGIGAAVAGGVAGSMGNHSSSDMQSGIDLNPASSQETNYLNSTSNLFGQLQGLTNQGPGSQDVSNSLNSSRSLADMLGQYAKSGGSPSAADLSTGNSLAQSVFAPQQTALNQSFINQTTDANRLAARLGRSVDDPILQAKLRTGFMNQQAQLNSQQGAWGTQYAMNLPGQRLNYAGQQSNILSNLASQAMQNRTALLNIGDQLGQQERDFRIQTGTRWANGSQSSGGGIGGAIAGGLGGLGTGLGIGKLLGPGGGTPQISSDMLGSMGGMVGGSSIFPSFSSSAPSIPSFSMNPYQTLGGNIGSQLIFPQGGGDFSSRQLASNGGWNIPSFRGGM